MPSLLRSAGRLLLAAMVASLALAVAPALAQTPPPNGISVTIQPPDGGTPETISTADVPNGDMNTTYTVGSQKIAVDGGVSIYQLLDRANANFAYAEIEIPRPDGSILRMSKDQVEDVKPAGFYTDDQGVTHFIGPTGSDGAVAARDYFAVSGSTTLTQLRKPKLQVAISPKKKKIDLGGKVTFKATVTGAEEGETLAYTWGISGKKQTQAGPRFTQEFPSKDGVYEFLVAVRIEGSEVSYSDVAKITVGDPEKGKQEQTGSGDSTDGGSTGDSTGTGTDGGSSYDSGSSYTPSYTPAPTPTPPAPPPPPTPSAEPPKAPDIATSSGTTVEGNVLADVSDPPPSNILEAAAAAREGKQRDDDAGPDGADVSEAALSIASVLALLALGAGIETREGRLPRWRLPQLRLPRRSA